MADEAAKPNLKEKLKKLVSEKLKKALVPDPSGNEEEATNQGLSAIVNSIATTVVSEAYRRSSLRDTEKNLGKKPLTKSDADKIIKEMGIKQKPIVVLNSPIAGGSNAFAHPARGLSKWLVLRGLQDSDLALYKKVKKEYDAVEGKGHWAVHLGKNVNDRATLGHELGHIKNREILENFMGKYPARAAELAGNIIAGIGMAPSLKDTPISVKETLLKTLATTPRLSDEYFASRHAKKDIGLDKDESSNLNKAFGTYLFAASGPARHHLLTEVIKKLRK